MGANNSLNNSSEINDVSRISAGTVIKGDITSPNDIRIDGTFEGRIFSQAKVVVGEKAVIKGDVICNNADFWGTMIKGNFFVKDTLSLKDTCVVDGDLHTGRLQVELGAKLTGSCRIITEEEFNQLTSESSTEMYDAQSPVQKEEDDFSIVSSKSPFDFSANDEIPEA